MNSHLFVIRVLENSGRLSRTRKGTSDVSASHQKCSLLKSGDELQRHAADNERRAATLAWRVAQSGLRWPEALLALVLNVAVEVNNGLLPLGLFRTWAHASTDGIEHALSPPDSILESLYQCTIETTRLWKCGLPIDAAASLEWELMFGPLHPFYDGCGRTSRIVGAALLYAAGLALPRHDLASAYFAAGSDGTETFAKYLRSVQQ